MRNIPPPFQNFLTSFLWFKEIAPSLWWYFSKDKWKCISEAFEDLHLILLPIICCSFLREGLDIKFRQTSSFCSLRKHEAFQSYSCKFFFSKKKFPEPCGINTFQSDHQTMWVGDIWCLQHWSKEVSDNSPSPALTAIAEGRIFNNNIHCANHKELIQNQR